MIELSGYYQDTIRIVRALGQALNTRTGVNIMSLFVCQVIGIVLDFEQISERFWVEQRPAQTFPKSNLEV